MNQRWLVRQLITYVPIVMLIISFLAYTAFFSLAEMARHSTEQVNALATERLLQLVDYSLQEIDKLVIKELNSNAPLLRYFYAGNDLEESEASETIRSWTMLNPFIHSVYLYRTADDRVLTNSLHVPLSAFTDVDFLQEQMERTESGRWTNPRMYREPSFQEKTERVVSLVKGVPFTNGELGLLVVNVKTSALEQILRPGSDDAASLVELYDTNGTAFNPQSPERSLKVLTELQSSYTGWIIRSGSAPFSFADYLDMSMITMVSVGLLTIVAGTLWFIFAIRMNDRPIGSIMNRLQAATVLKEDGPPRTGSHELQIIEAAIDNLVQQSLDYEKTHEEDVTLRRRVFFHDVLRGHRIVSTEAWRKEMEQLHLAPGSHGFRMAVADIDQDSRLYADYPQRDKNLLKFAMGNVAIELAASAKLPIWVEWLEGSRMGILFLDDDPALSSVVLDMLERYREWVQHHLKYTVTIGLGSCVKSSEDILATCGQAEEALENKMITDVNQVLVYEQIVQDARQAPLHAGGSFEDDTRASREARQYAPIVEQIRRYIDEHYTNPDISLTHLGEVFQTNPKYISFIFKEQLGINFVNYLTDVRVEQAKRLLESTDDLIPDIAAQVGYMHAVSFNRVFKKVVGMTPGGYRSRNV
ncbi:putative AraC family transcriptional regulator [Paenibacillus sp. 598K]|uniref:helix-turn-helix transcriptional regulator n=1 Tax=Paenibacillus sp. 598K TaxID=1117987 RepID=UPI000FFAF81D|nr:cache domain-containing protein [Paenibacillus sp. 598K]GBF76804.1 putative AraC family transcriptional regulator [Paenibacillus sp. 598K]